MTRPQKNLPACSTRISKPTRPALAPKSELRRRKYKIRWHFQEHYEDRFRPRRHRRASHRFRGNGETFLPHQGEPDWEADGNAEARRVLVETATFSERSRRRTGEHSATNDAR